MGAAPGGSSGLSGSPWQVRGTWELMTVTYPPVGQVALKCSCTGAICHSSLPARRNRRNGRNRSGKLGPSPWEGRQRWGVEMDRVRARQGGG